ncbi:sugar ABC transporter ATP-binding protein [Isoptericola sp. b441]|uniref:Sugar ABC transporter ATP-binding protein n=1 Tax=Actinotalea lenta TaxID=3064654 RepID=A0ABT9D9L7_9CELL|nr:sugar ABC transporter ATP-binding protein [Isoptericola sp. b441]MDO8107181.1 sugar ABC transporter ATP-binding protein [Isoptericola sp. b441]
MTTSDDGLVVRGVTKQYPGTRALHDVDVHVGPGECVALLGENGAGKSTLAGIIAGITQPTEGTMLWHGEPFAPASPSDSIAAGVGLIHQEMRLLPDLSVAENVLVGRWPTRSGGWVSRGQMRARAQEKLEQLGFTQSMDVPVRTLSVAGQQQVEIAKALMLDAKLLILDEPTAALGAHETEALFERIHLLKADGVSFIYVSHRLAEIRQIADRIVVLRDGEKVAEHATADVPQDQLIKEMVGRSVDRLFPEVRPPADRVVLEVESLSSPTGRFRDISFEVRAGEVFGIAGIVGAGRTELVRAITGADPSHGTVRVDGAEVRRHSVQGAIKAGMVMIPEDRKGQGVIVPDTIQDNVVIANLDRIAPGGWLAPRKARQTAAHAVERFGVKGKPEHLVSSLSGGNQQKVVLAKWLERGPKVVILDEPTRGIDVGARASIYDVITELSRAGVAIVVVSSDLDEVLGLSHRVMVLSRGTDRGVLERDEAEAARVIELATT